MVRLQQQNYRMQNSKIQQLGSCAAAHSADSGDGSRQNTVVVAVREFIHTNW